MEKIRTLEIKFNHLLTSIFLGNYKTAFKGKGVEFSNFKNYEQGEDSKNIDWLVSAREGKILVKEFQENRELEVLFVFDITETMSFGLNQRKLDTLINLFYLLGLSSLSSGGSIGGLFLGKSNERLGFSKGKGSILKILNIIDKIYEKNLDNIGKLDFNEIINYKNKLVFIFTDKLDIDEKKFRILTLKNDVIFVNIFDNFENTLTGVDGCIGLGGIFINLDNKDKKREYLALREAKIKSLMKKININGADYLTVDNKSNLYKKILKLMKERQR